MLNCDFCHIDLVYKSYLQLNDPIIEAAMPRTSLLVA